MREQLAQARSGVLELAAQPAASWTAALRSSGETLSAAAGALRGTAGITALIRDPELSEAVATATAAIRDTALALEAGLDKGSELDAAGLEACNAALIQVKDLCWSLGRDRLQTAATVTDLGGDGLGDAAIEALTSVTQALAALDRLEVRGRDSAGIQVLVSGHGLELATLDLDGRDQDPLFTNRAVRIADGNLIFVYKAAAEIGELGDNTAAIREALRHDSLLHRALAADSAEAGVLGHTRWASVGIISQANAHPVNHEETEGSGPYVAAVLNGDVDNYAELRDAEGLNFAPEITTDTKVIPSMVSRRLAEGEALLEAFQQTVSQFIGSVAIGCQTGVDPEQMLLALRGSGQGVYVGLAEDSFIVASEPYGVVEETATYLRLDGETPGNPDNPAGSQGQILVLDRARAGELGGMRRIAYDGTPLPVTEADLSHAEITTRDIDRGDSRHYLLKEISEAPRSFHKTLRGKIEAADGRLRVALGEQTLPAAIRENLRSGAYKRLLVIGQGTAAVAGQGVAAAMEDAFAGTDLQIRALPATELSGFGLRDDMSDTLIVAISQSGTTTDTNRTVDLARGRGASVLAIVNRRNSDLCDKSDGVLFTSDGRDVEMSVASTKAFYAQIAAGFLLAFALRQELGNEAPEQQELLQALRALPEALDALLQTQASIAEAARRHVRSRRYWALVGNGKNKVAAEEIRIKLSELCYKSMACDATEDKKHIDLSSEPLILVCAAGLSGSTADDVAKELAIYRAHKAAPILITSDDPARFPAALEVLRTPEVHPGLSFILSTMAGHLFGYYAALAIDASADPMRQMRVAIEELVSTGTPADGMLLALEPRCAASLDAYEKLLDDGEYDGHLEARTACRLDRLLGYLRGTKPLDSYETETGTVGTPAKVVEALNEALTRAIEELTRPVDAIKHQAKTVTVGISRADEALLSVPLIEALLDAGAPRERISYKALQGLAALDAAVQQVTGATRYAIQGSGDEPRLEVISQTGSAAGIKSRVEQDPRLRGTKHLVASEREILIAQGRADGRSVLLVPEVQAGRSTGLTLLHLEMQERLAPGAMAQVLKGYRQRLAALRDLVLETEAGFDEAPLAEATPLELLTIPVHVLADRWRRG